MEYISIGAVVKQSTEKLLWVSHGGHDFQLIGKQAALWLNGRCKVAKLDAPACEKALDHLRLMGLIVPVSQSEKGRYWALTSLVICPANKMNLYRWLNTEEKNLLRWLTEAGLRLSIAELVYLMEHEIGLTPELLGPDNRQALVETIYTRDNIVDNILENEMEKANACQKTVDLVFSLLKKRKLVLI